MLSRITGIGSRTAPQAICDEMIKVGAWCKENRIIVRSGHAKGCDYSFELGAQEFCIAYLSWASFNNQTTTQAVYKVLNHPQAEVLARKFHPAFDKLSFGAKKLMARNSYQVLGDELDEPSDAIVCWTEGGGFKGGTAQALRIAAAYNIPVLNMWFEEYNTAEKVIKRLRGMI